MLALVFNQRALAVVAQPTPGLRPLLISPPTPYHRPRPIAQSYNAMTRELVYNDAKYGDVTVAQYRQFQMATNKNAFIWQFLRGRRRA